jgi:lipoyl-dependent peroxiredoxin
MKRFGSEAWNGGLREGKGSVSTESRVLETYPYTFFSRGKKPGTNPEELLGAAHAACFTMPFVRLLSMANFVPEHRMAAKACAHSAHRRNWCILNRGDWRSRL